jgi:hypothetical protein
MYLDMEKVTKFISALTLLPAPESFGLNNAEDEKP